MRFWDVFKRKLKTVFDYSPSEKELYLLGIEDKEKYMNGIEQKKAYVHLAYLFYFRGKMKKADRFINKTKDCNAINSFWRIIGHYETAKESFK